MKSKQVDAYIAKSAVFAQPILEHLRHLVHKTCPAVEETIKWGFPHFEYKGILCSMASFKEHCAFGFWKASLMKDKSLMKNAKSETAMGHMGRITGIKDLPSDKVMLGYIKEAVMLNESGVKVEKKKTEKEPVAVPAYLKKALAQNKKAKEVFDAFSPSHQREYIEWLTEAKTEATKEKRLEQALEWMQEGKARNWKYARK